jgi:hypothetical protein
MDSNTHIEPILIYFIEGSIPSSSPDKQKSPLKDLRGLFYLMAEKEGLFGLSASPYGLPMPRFGIHGCSTPISNPS